MTNKTRILVVDDELPVCKSISSALSAEDYIVDMALSAEEALKKDEEHHYDLIITDLMMPGLSGMDLLKNLRSKGADARVIMITGYPSIESAVQSIKFGAFDYIPKPFTPRELRSLVVRAIESKRYREAQLVEQGKAGEARRGAVTPPTGVYVIPENSWAAVEKDGTVRIGIHHQFVKTIEKVATIELPKQSEMRYQGEACMRISDSTGNIHKVWTPVGGRIVSVNETIKTDVSLLAHDPYGEGWALLVKPINLERDLKNLVASPTAGSP